MSHALKFDTPFDKAVRASGLTRAEFARRAMVSVSTLYKGRALNPDRGKIHWTSIVMMGTQAGIFRLGEDVFEDDPRVAYLVNGLVGKRGRGAARWNEFQSTRPRLSLAS